MAAKFHSIDDLLFQLQNLVAVNDHKQAYKISRKGISLFSPNPDVFLVCATSAYYCGKSVEAVKLLRKALRLWPDNADFLFNLGYILNFTSQPHEAIEPLRRLVDIDPDYPSVQTNLAAAYFTTNQFETAKISCLKAIELAGDTPDVAELYNLLGSIYRELENSNLSEEAFRKAFEIDPEYVDAHSNLAMMLEESSQLDAAIEVSREGLKRFPNNNGFSLVLAKCERRRGKSNDSAERLSEIDLDKETPDLAAAILYELGRCWDRENSIDRAYDSFSKANEVTKSQTPQSIKKGYFPKILEASSKYYGKNEFCIPKAPQGDGNPQPVFLIGFPRSGTTLLELTLAGHPKIAVMEETPLVGEMYSSITNSSVSYPMVLDKLNDDEIQELRAGYFKRSADYTNLDDKSVLINKHPVNTVYLPVILSVFPEAKIIFSARHPVDVCLSCWMQEFKLNHSNVNFLNLHDAVDFYASCMDLWMHFQSHVPMQHVVVSYENIVEDHEKTAKQVIKFLDLDWNSSVLNHIDTAKAVPRVNTASYHQVTEPIYDRSKFRWERYRDHLGAILPKLQKYVDHFGYKM